MAQVKVYPAGRTAILSAATILVLSIYFYPFFHTRSTVGATVLPPEFAPDLTLYLNLSNATAIGENQVLNPYYQIPVPNNGAGYLKFSLDTQVFHKIESWSGGRTWLALFIWNLFWWGLLCLAALWLFEKFLPLASLGVVLTGLGLLMFFNFGVLKTLLAAWAHLPSLAGFQSLDLPYMRAFIPQVAVVFLLGYLGLQMEVLRRSRPLLWAAMGALQFFALTVFPYTTLMMAGLTAVSVLWQLFFSKQQAAWLAALVYGVGCAMVDAVFLKHGSVGFYASSSSTIHFQPGLLIHLVGGNWLLLAVITVAVALIKNLAAEVKWPLVGLGTANLALMLGDAVVPASVLLLSHHAAHFLHTTVAVLLTFVSSAALLGRWEKSISLRIALGLCLGFLVAGGVLLASGSYEASLPVNGEQVRLARSLDSWKPGEQDLLIARSRDVDDACGWAVLLTKARVLFCTDAEILLTPQQNRDIHRARQALYLYLSGEDSGSLRQGLAGADPGQLMYRLGYWAEAVSLSTAERREGIRAIQTELIPQLERVERHDATAGDFFRQFRRIIVLDDERNPTFPAARVTSFLQVEDEKHVDGLVVLSCVPK